METKIRPGKYNLDQKKLKRAKLILNTFSIAEIIEKSLSNLKRWKANDVWCSAYTEWQEIMEGGDSAVIRDAMIGDSERSTRLRQSPPYVGLLKLDLTPEQESVSDKILKRKK
jgi:hypothetical protein